MGFWNEVPIMPRARGGRDINGTFACVVPAGIDAVRVSYRRETSDHGWRPTSSVTTDDGRFTMLVFEKGDVNVGFSTTVLGQNTSFVTLGIY
jgi:hypothetical protein